MEPCKKNARVKIRVVLDRKETKQFHDTGQIKRAVKRDAALFRSYGGIGLLGAAKAK